MSCAYSSVQLDRSRVKKSTENVASIVFYVVYLPAAKESIFNDNIQTLPFVVLAINFWIFGKNSVTLLLTVAKWWCIKLYALFSGPPYTRIYRLKWVTDTVTTTLHGHFLQSESIVIISRNHLVCEYYHCAYETTEYSPVFVHVRTPCSDESDDMAWLLHGRSHLSAGRCVAAAGRAQSRWWSGRHAARGVSRQMSW